MAKEILYRYAFDEDDNVIDALTLSREEGLDSYHCPGCQSKLTPVLSKSRAKHFRHDNKDNCSSETHLHNLAKRHFYNYYKSALRDGTPIYLKQERKLRCTSYIKVTKQSCNFGKEAVRHDITRYFDSCELEVAHGNFRPDVLLKSPKNEVMYIEIAVSHPCEQRKIESGSRIVEFVITSEDDLPLLTQTLNASEENPKVKFYNFKDAKPGESDCGGQCSISQFPAFLLHQSGKLQYTLLSPKGVVNLPNNQKLQTYIVGQKELVARSTSRTVHGSAYSDIVSKAIEQKLKIVSCAACKDRRNAKFSHTGFYCKSKQIDVSVNEASHCINYRPFKSLQELQWYLDKGL